MPNLTVNGHSVALNNARPSLTLLEYLRTSLGLTGTKEGCASGDCGACTVIVKRGDEYQTVNSCIAPAAAFTDAEIITVEGVGCADQWHPVQTAMVDCHGSQCGFCTPGFVMSLVALVQQGRNNVNRDEVAHAIGGNLCRCTGYRPIIEAGLAAAQEPAPTLPCKTQPPVARDLESGAPPSYLRVTSLNELWTARQATSRLVAGGTDLWLEVTQLLNEFEHVIDLSECAELHGIQQNGQRLRIGAAVTHTELLHYFTQNESCAAIEHLLDRFGSPQVRNRGTIGGNIANASPIADWPPVLIALDASLILSSPSGQRGVPIADYYQDYKRTVLAADEIIEAIEFDMIDWPQLQFFKISKRTEDDISSVALAACKDGDQWRIGVGGVAAVPLRLTGIESMLAQGADWSAIQAELARSVKPITDVRASADYRSAMTEALLRKAVDQAEERP